MPTAVDMVAERISNDRAFATSVTSKTEAHQASPTARIRDYFPEFHRPDAHPLSNLPEGIQARQYLLYGQPFPFNLVPMREKEFEARYQLRVGFVRSLADAGLLYPTIYVREPQSWQDGGDLKPLLDIAISPGDRVDTYLSSLGDYDDAVLRHSLSLGRALDDLSPRGLDTLLRREAVASRSHFVARHARRWAYLDLLCPQAAYDADTLLQSGRLVDHLKYVALAKPYMASPVTAAFGGDYVFGPRHVAKPPTNGTLLRPGLEYPEAIDYLLYELSGIEPYAPLQSTVREDRLLEFLTHPSNAALRRKIPGALADLWTAAQSGTLSRAAVRDYRRLMADYRRRLSLGKFVLEGTAKAAKLSGPMAHGVPLGPLLTVAGLGASMLAPGAGKAVGKLISAISPGYEKHRAFLYIEQLRSFRSRG